MVPHVMAMCFLVIASQKALHKEESRKLPISWSNRSSNIPPSFLLGNPRQIWTFEDLVKKIIMELKWPWKLTLYLQNPPYLESKLMFSHCFKLPTPPSQGSNVLPGSMEKKGEGGIWRCGCWSCKLIGA